MQVKPRCKLCLTVPAVMVNPPKQHGLITDPDFVKSMNNSHACASTLETAHNQRALHASQVKMPYPLQSVRVS